MYLTELKSFIFTLVLAIIKPHMCILPWLHCLTWLTAWAFLSVCSSGPGSLARLLFLWGMCSHPTAVSQLNVVEAYIVGCAMLTMESSEQRRANMRGPQVPELQVGSLVWQFSSLPQHIVMFTKGSFKILIRQYHVIWKKFLKSWNNTAWDCAMPYKSRRKGTFP